MKIDWNLVLMNSSKKRSDIFSIVNNKQNIGGYEVEKRILENDKDLNFQFQFILQKESFVDLRLRLQISFDDNEEMISIPEHFPHFNFKSLSPLLIQVVTNKQNLLLHSHRSYAYQIFDKSKQSLSIDFFIDAPFLHPSWSYETSQRASTAAPLQKEGTQYKFEIVFNQSNNAKTFIPVQQFMFPFAYNATFILTDHCDFDTETKLNVFLNGDDKNGWLHRGIKISKGVFTLARGGAEPTKNASLEDVKYKDLIQALYDDGSEIVPHALKSRGQLTSDEFQKALKTLNDYFHPQTWIDHGCFLKYCYSQGAAKNPDYLLVDSLKKYSYNNLWSYHDVNIDANDTLNIFATKTKFPFKILRLSFKYFFLGKWLIAAHYLRSILHRNYSKNVALEYLMYIMANTKPLIINLKNKKASFFNDLKFFFKRLFKFNSFKNDTPVPYQNKDVLLYSSPLYLETHKPLAQYSGNELLFFYSFETTHLLDIYNKKALDKLVSEYGLHLGHTYILNDLPYINSIFKKKNGSYFLGQKWISFLEILSQYIKDKKIWNPNMNEYAAYTILLQNVKIEYVADGKIEVVNHNDKAVHGYTLAVPVSFPASLIVNDKKINALFSDTKYHFFVLDLEKNIPDF